MKSFDWTPEASAVPTKFVWFAVRVSFAESQEPAAPEKSVPEPKSQTTLKPSFVFVFQVPVVGPGMVTDFFSQVFAAETAYSATYERSLAEFWTATQ